MVGLLIALLAVAGPVAVMGQGGQPPAGTKASKLPLTPQVVIEQPSGKGPVAPYVAPPTITQPANLHPKKAKPLPKPQKEVSSSAVDGWQQGDPTDEKSSTKVDGVDPGDVPD